MQSEIIVALLSLAGTLAGSLAGIMMSNRLTIYRIDQLEKKVNAHNSLIERTYRLEENERVTDEKIKVINHRIEDLEGQI